MRVGQVRVVGLVCGLWAACGSEPVATKPGTVAPPLCTSVLSFGNGVACNANDPTIALCGTQARRVCASNWLCFDAPELVDCRCEQDLDCTSRTTYINEARSVANKAPLANKCTNGRCAGRP